MYNIKVYGPTILFVHVCLYVFVIIDEHGKKGCHKNNIEWTVFTLISTLKRKNTLLVSIFLQNVKREALSGEGRIFFPFHLTPSSNTQSFIICIEIYSDSFSHEIYIYT